MNRKGTLIVILALVFFNAFPARGEDDLFFAKIWEKALPKLEKSLEIFDRSKDLPESSFLREDKQSNRKKYEELLDSIFTILIGSELNNVRQEYNFLQIKMEQAGDEIELLLKERITAPEKSWNPFEKTRAGSTKNRIFTGGYKTLTARKEEPRAAITRSLAGLGWTRRTASSTYSFRA